MVRKLYISFLLLFTIIPQAYSSHIYGGELLYEHVSGLTYRVMVILYGDCGGNQNSFNTLINGAAEVRVVDASPVPYATLNLPIDLSQSNIEVTPVCPDEAGNTQCSNIINPIPGIKKYVYQQDITLPYASATWGFVFTGNMGNAVQAGRTANITNLPSVQSIIYLIARLNNLNGPNSSPVYTTVPTPFYCINVLQQYNHGATDPNNDSLAFSLVTGLNNGQAINYLVPYSAQFPLAEDSFSFNQLNGQMTFRPNLIQRSLVVNEVREYKNGVLVGSSMREMSFIVLDNCQNEPPNGDLASHGSNILGGVHDGHNVINVCAGTPQVSFDLSPADPNNSDDVMLTTYNVPANATVTISNNGTPQPTVHFTWNTSIVPPGIYTFYINYKDNGCPLSSNQTIAYTIQIGGPYSVSAEVLSHTNCYHKAGVRYQLSGGVKPRIIQVKQGNTMIKTLVDTTGVVNDSLLAGTYTLHVFSQHYACDTNFTFTVADSGTFPFVPATEDHEYCKGDVPTLLTANPVDGGSLNWYDSSGNLLAGAPSYGTNVPGTYTWHVSQLVSVCYSDTAAIRVTIHDRPDVNILNRPGKVCYADRIYLEAEGAYNYLWMPVGLIHKDAEGRPYGIITEPVTYTVIGVDTNSCNDTADIRYTEIEKCCNFAYPNAFTPNRDGKNDRFRPVMYGNMEEYEISVYNRFGERVYHSKDPQGGWDGTYNGELCDIGMYYFRVKAKCFTGQYEEKADAVDLLR